MLPNLLMRRELGDQRAQPQLEKIVPSTLMHAGGDSSFIVKNNLFFACGNNDDGQLGLGYCSLSQTTLTENTFFTEKIVQSIVVGGCCILFRMEDGNIYACGYNEYGQLGLAHIANSDTPIAVF